MDAFAQSWENLHLWICPPVSLVAKAFHCLAASPGASGVFCVPAWRTSPFWLVLFPDGTHCASMIKNFTFFSPKYYSGGAVRSKMFRGVPHWETLAFFVEADTPNALEPNFDSKFCLLNGCRFCRD